MDRNCFTLVVRGCRSDLVAEAALCALEEYALEEVLQKIENETNTWNKRKNVSNF